MSGNRSLKLADQIKVIAAEMLERRIKDPRLGFVTITDSRLSGDNREATLFYTVYGTPEEVEDSAAALHDARGQIRTVVSKQLGLKFAPTITFVPDAMAENAAVIEGVLAQARKADEEVAAQRATASYAGDPDPYKVKGQPPAEDAADSCD